MTAVEEGTTLAAVDLGSNSFHMIVGRVTEGELVIVDRLKEMVRLAGGLDPETRELDAETQERALACLERFGQRLNHLPPSGVRAVGTNTLRSARNADDFRSRAEAALGHRVEIVAGMEEARLIYLGVTRSLAGEGRQLVMDIGGGSTEFIIGTGPEPESLESLHMGCVSTSRAHFPDGRITEKAYDRARRAVASELEPIRGRFRREGWERAIGASGTIRSVAKVLEAQGWAPPETITAEGLRKLWKRLLKVGSAEAADLKGLKDERLPVFAGGAAVLTGALEMLGVEEMEVSDGAMREGLLQDLLGRLHHTDVRGRTVESLCQRYHVDTDHAARVAATAGSLLDQLEPEPVDDAPWYLEWAARLHEIGLDIAHSSYHKHGAYILANADMAGFSRAEQAILAALVRAHRRKFRRDTFDAVDPGRREAVVRLAILLRLAAALHRSRDDTAPPSPGIRVKGSTWTLTFPAGWLDEHPLTVTDLETEADYLARADYTLRFRESEG
ncbi:exopolyphosphatase [Thiohalospira sp.]|uniref:exopolyphosphatase n=1 Tax=Thiohalospira sp. TaxID=3080549 RepID=UPI0039806A8C